MLEILELLVPLVLPVQEIPETLVEEVAEVEVEQVGRCLDLRDNQLLLAVLPVAIVVLLIPPPMMDHLELLEMQEQPILEDLVVLEVLELLEMSEHLQLL